MNLRECYPCMQLRTQLCIKHLNLYWKKLLEDYLRVKYLQPTEQRLAANWMKVSSWLLNFVERQPLLLKWGETPSYPPCALPASLSTLGVGEAAVLLYNSHHYHFHPPPHSFLGLMVAWPGQLGPSWPIPLPNSPVPSSGVDGCPARPDSTILLPASPPPPPQGYMAGGNPAVPALQYTVPALEIEWFCMVPYKAPQTKYLSLRTLKFHQYQHETHSDKQKKKQGTGTLRNDAIIALKLVNFCFLKSEIHTFML
jgi:hypothetical protein